MRAILTVFAKEFRENLRDRRTLFTALIFGPLFAPLLFAAILSLMIQRGDAQKDQPLSLAIAHGERAPNLVSQLVAYGVTVVPVSYEDADARAAVQRHEHKLVLMVPEDYAIRFAAGRPAPLMLYSDASDNFAERDERRVKAVIAQYSSTLTRLRMTARGLDPMMLAPIAVHDVDVSTPASRSVLALGTMSYFILLTMLMGGLYLSIDATAGERERGSLEPLLTTPVRREHLIYGKILAACAYMTLSLVLSVTALSIVLRFVGLEGFGMSANFGPLIAVKMILYCVPLIPLGASLMTIVAAYTRSYREAQTYLGLVLLVPTLPLVFASALGLRPTLPLMAVPSLSQHFLITSLLRDEALPLSHTALSIGATLALGLVLAAIAGRLYHREALLG
ncbi:MAG TPA: ABC transporter permease [Steroidobacteraceae bacterium]|jgi:sodium transport system permease protein|nr:ABC transporter permease [Steroidobacteraceae bacterium]